MNFHIKLIYEFDFLALIKTMDFAAFQVAPFKKIHRIEAIGKIPKSASGKILR